jgi:predicted Rossmann fold nucleotide-binding protein DprA/Smf involved in DNA uptake
VIIDVTLNTQAVLLLTAPLLAGKNIPNTETLTPGEYNRLGRHLRELKKQPSDFLGNDSEALINACDPIIEKGRLQRLLARGFLLSQAIELWRSRAIWIVSRSDSLYPQRLKNRLGEAAPALVYGCGDHALLDKGGLAVVGSRDIDDSLILYTKTVAKLAARAGRTIISGGARGVDQAAMQGAVEAGGTVCGVLADSLEKTILNRENRNLLLEKKITLISPFDPNARFLVGNAMQRNKYIYALADASLVVNSDYEKGGTWAGAKEQLQKYKLVPLYVRSTGILSKGLDALLRKGARPWPNPKDEDELCALIDTPIPVIRIPEDTGQLAFVSEKPKGIEISQPVQGSIEAISINDQILALLTQSMTEKELIEKLMCEKKELMSALKELLNSNRVIKTKTKPIRYVIKTPELFD